MKNHAFIKILILSSIILFFGNCVLATNLNAQRTPEVVSKKQIFNVGNGAEPKSLDPILATGIPEANIIDNLFEGLVSFEPYNLDPVPGVASSWTVSSDQMTYTFKIRDNSFWNDGKKITAEDFLWSWKRALSKETAAEYAYQLYYIKNAEAFHKGSLKDPNTLGIKVLDPLTLQVQLERPTPFFLKLCAFHVLYPIPKHIVEKFKSYEEWTRVGNLVSNGPFKMVRWDLNSRITMVPNEYYWDRDFVKLKEVHVYPIESAEVEEKNFHAGMLHQTETIPNLKTPFYEEIRSKNPTDPYLSYKTNPYIASYFYRFNTNRKPLNDVRVRKALSMVIDRKLIVDKIVRGGNIPAVGFTPPFTGGGYVFQGDSPVKESVTPEIILEAQQLLTEAGYPGGKGMPKISILYNTFDLHKKIALAIQQMWKKELGVVVELYNQEWKVFLDSETKMDFYISRAAWIGDYPDPNTFLNIFISSSGNNHTGWSNKSYDEYILKAETAITNAQRNDYFQKAETLLMQNMPIIPIYHYIKQRLVSDKVRMQTKDGKLTPWRGNIIDRMVLKHLVIVD